MFSTGFKGVGLHYTAFADAIRGDSRQTAPSRGVSPRKKFAVKANVESRVKPHNLVGTAFHRRPRTLVGRDEGIVANPGGVAYGVFFGNRKIVLPNVCRRRNICGVCDYT